MDSPIGINEAVITDANYTQFIEPMVAGVRKASGLNPRNYATHPVGYMAVAKPFDLALIPESEWQARLDAQIANKAQLSDIRNSSGPNGGPIPSRDQDGKGYCFAPGVKVRLHDGYDKLIEDFVGGEKVLSHLGDHCIVTKPTNRLYTGEMYTVKPHGYGPAVDVTSDHQFFTNEGTWIAAKDLKNYTRLIHRGEAVSIYPPTVKQVVDFQVHCLEVEGDHSFIANGLSAHNCWAHSSTSASLIVRAVAGEPYADLSAYCVACIIKGYRDEGGWGSESLEWIAENGIPSSEFWPQQSMDRSNDNPAMRANAKLHRITEWMDLQPNNKAQLVTCLLLGIPVVVDFNWWSHSVCAIDLVSLSPFRIRIWNSWGDKWSENGTGILEGSKAIPDGQIAPRVSLPSQT